MSELEKDYKAAKDTVKVILIVIALQVWWGWCMEKPLRFLYTALIIGGLMFIAHTQSYEYQHPDCVLCQ